MDHTSRFYQKISSDPEFKKRHMKYVSEKVTCPDCGKQYSRCNVSHHKATKFHKSKVLQEETLNNSINIMNNLPQQIDAEKFNQLVQNLDIIVKTLQITHP